MRAHEFVTEKKRKRKKPRWAAYGPGPYGGYGYATGYSGDGGGVGGDGGVGEGSLNEFAPGGNSSSSYYAVTSNFVKEFVQQKQEELQDLIDAGWTKQDLAQAGTLKGQAADIEHFEQVRDGFLKGLKPGFDAYLQGDTQLKDQLGTYWLENDLPLNQDWEKIYGEPWGDDSEFNEGWKDWAAAGALGTALAFGSPGDAEAAKPKAKDPISQVSKKEISKSVTGNPHEVYLKKAAEKAGIKGNELAAFLAQCAHETMDFKHMKEIGGVLDFKKYDIKFAPKKAKVLGNTKPGDGAKYKGRGYIQLTGKYNYKKAGDALGIDLVNKPELLEKPEIAAKVAVWYWKERVRDKVDNFKNTKDVTKPINPGMKHLDQRKEKHQAFMVAMK